MTLPDRAGISEAPWTNEQVANIQSFQDSGRMHPFTCANQASHIDGSRDPLEPHIYGMVCKADGCGYIQTWVHDFMVTEDWNDPKWDSVMPRTK
jgi:hypothetical protein